MFEAMTSRPSAPRENAAGMGLSLLFFGVVGVAGTLLVAGGHTAQQVADVAVSFVSAQSAPAAAAAAPPAGGAAGASAEKPVEKKVVPKKRELSLDTKQAKQIPIEREPEREPEPQPRPADTETQAVPGGVQGGVTGGVAGGVVGGVVGGTVGGAVGGSSGGSGGGTSALPFGLGMTRPVQTSGSAPQYSREAIAARVEGKVIVRCVITVKGTVQDCKVIKGVPMLDDISVAALLASRFSPVTYQGRAEAVQYLFTFNFKLP